MINIFVDEKACVGCELCVDVCPTKVYAYDEAKGVPQVVRPKECFGCLYCAQECPADALSHAGLTRPDHFYHDPYALNLASRLGGNGTVAGLQTSDPAKIAAAQEDIGVRLTALSMVLRSTLGSGMGGVGTTAGRMLARQVPRYRAPRSVDELLEVVRDEFSPAWDLEFDRTEDKLGITVKACFVRELCTKGRAELGGDLCSLFYNYLSGYMNGMGNLKLRPAGATRGTEECKYEMLMLA